LATSEDRTGTDATALFSNKTKPAAGAAGDIAGHPEQAFLAQRRIRASRAMRRVLRDAKIARLARFLT